MTARYQELRDRTVAAVDSVHSELVRIVPQRGVSQYKVGAPDPDRLPFEISAILRIAGDQSDLAGEGQRSWNTELAAGEATLSIARLVLPPGASIRQKDWIVALDRGDARFEVNRVDDRGHVRMVLHLTSL